MLTHQTITDKINLSREFYTNQKDFDRDLKIKTIRNDNYTFINDIDKEWRQLAEINYKRFHIVTSFRPIKSSTRTQIPLTDLSIILKKSLNRLSNKFLGKFQNSPINARVARIIYPGTKSAKGDYTHFHGLYLLPDYLIPEFYSIYNEVFKKCTNSSLYEPHFVSTPYYETSENFIFYAGREAIPEFGNKYFDNIDTELSIFKPTATVLPIYEQLSRLKRAESKYIERYSRDSQIISKSIHGLPSLAVVRLDLESKFEKVINENNADFTILKAVVGAGKSSLLNKLDSLLTEDKRTLVLFQRNDQMKDIRVGKPYPEIPVTFKEKFQKLYSLHINPIDYFKKMDSKDLLNPIESAEFKHYMQRIESLKSERIVLATHERYFRGGFSELDFDLVIFDECFIKTLYKQVEFSNEELNSIKNELFNHLPKDEVESFFDQIVNSKSNHISEIQCPTSIKLHIENSIKETDASCDIDSLSMSPFNQKTLKLTSIDSFLKTNEGIEFLEDFNFPLVKTVVLSSTAQDNIYKTIFNERLKVREIQKPPLISDILQYTDSNYSKTDCTSKRKDEILNIIQDYKGKGYSVISFKEFDDHIDAHFFALESKNDFKGKDLLIIGTPNVSPDYLKLLAHRFNLDYESIKNYGDIKTEKIHYKDMDIYYPILSKNKEIQKLQFDLIHGELEQAIGRTRPYEYSSKVRVLSKFPCQMARKY